MTELWKEIAWAPGYQISSFGRLLGKNGSILSPVLNRKGYVEYRICIGTRRNNRGGSLKSVRAHRLVADAFIPHVEGKPEVNHKDFDKTNNIDTNLEWCTREENMAHAVAGGRFAHVGVTTFGDVELIHKCQSLYASGEDFSSISKKTGIAAGTIRDLLRGISFQGKYRVDRNPRVPGLQDEVVRLRRQTEKSFKAIAEQLGISDSQAHRLYHRGAN